MPRSTERVSLGLRLEESQVRGTRQSPRRPGGNPRVRCWAAGRDRSHSVINESLGAVQPSATVTLVFTDIEGSTSLLQALGDRYPEVLADHHRLIREAFARHGALERGSAGDGLYFVFGAAQAAIDGQLAVAG